MQASLSYETHIHDEGYRELVTHDLFSRPTVYNRQSHARDFLFNLLGIKTPKIPLIVFQIVCHDYLQYRQYAVGSLPPTPRLLNRILKDRHWHLYAEYRPQFVRYIENTIHPSGGVVDTTSNNNLNITARTCLARRLRCVLLATNAERVGVGMGRRNIFYLSYITHKLTQYPDSMLLSGCGTVPRGATVRRRLDVWWQLILDRCRRMFPELDW